MNAWVAIVTVVALMLYIVTSLRVASARQRFKVEPPAMTGPPELERAFRVQANTLEWLVIALPAMWLFAAFLNPLWAAALGLAWVCGRIVYMIGYSQAAEKRHLGFAIQGLAAIALLLGALVGAVMHLI